MAHVIKDIVDLNKRVNEMEKIIIDLRIGIAKIVLIGAVCTALATPVLSAILIKLIMKG
jgi:hypothetical protein